MQENKIENENHLIDDRVYVPSEHVELLGRVN